MKYFFIFILLPFILSAQQTYVPDDNFEQALIDLKLDTPPLNDSVPTKNIDTVERLPVRPGKISDLTGISGFTKLVYLSCSYNLLTKLDLSKNINLVELHCYENQIVTLDIELCTNLEKLYCFNNKLGSLDVSKNNKLIKLYCAFNNLTTLNVRNGNNKNMLGFSGWATEDGLSASYNPNLTCIQVDDSSWSANYELWRIDSTAHYSENCNYTGFDDLKLVYKSINISPNPAMDYIEINVSPLEQGEHHCAMFTGGVACIQIYNILGMEITSPSLRATPPYQGGEIRIDVSGLKAGIYFVRVGDEVKKFVKM